MVLGLALKSLIHFKLIFACGVREGPNFILLHVDIQFSHQLLKRPFFTNCIFSAPLSNINSPYIYVCVYYWALNSVQLVCVCFYVSSILF